jgi:hypothetical protein
MHRMRSILPFINNYNLCDLSPAQGKRITSRLKGQCPKREEGGVASYIYGTLIYYLPFQIPIPSVSAKGTPAAYPQNPKKFSYAQKRSDGKFWKKN